VCVLLRQDGQYHLGRVSSDKAQVFEGSISGSTVEELSSLVNRNELHQLSQNKIQLPLVSSERHELILSVHRPNYWQILRFPDPESRKPLRASLDPLITWLGMLQKEKHRQLGEDSAKNNCLPPLEKVELAKRIDAARPDSAWRPLERHVGTRTPDLYRVKLDFNHLQPFSFPFHICQKQT